MRKAISFLVLLAAGALIFPYAAAATQGQSGGQRGGVAGAGQSAVAPQPAPPLNLPPGDAKRGQSFYLKNGCWECHGYTGATGTGAVLATTVLNANGFVNYIRNPRTAGMPLFSSKVVPDADAADLFAYIKTFKKPAEAKDIPLLQQIINEK